MSWFINSEVNNGYPSLDNWKTSWETDWTSNNNIRYPDYMYRIKTGVNNGYPWIYPWFKEDTYDQGEMVIGGSRSNYPSGFSNSDKGGIRDYFDDDSMISTSNNGGQYGNYVLMSAVEGRAFCLTGQQLNTALASLNDPNVIDTDEIEIIAKMYGANVFDAFISCKVFPFDLAQLGFRRYFWNDWMSVVSSSTGSIKAFGKYTLANGVNLLASSYGCYTFPSIHVPVKQAWEIESIDFSIYLPFAGVFPLDIRSECDINITLYVDLISGIGEYYVYTNEQLSGIHRVMFGADVPINSNQGKMQANFNANVTSSMIKGAQLLAGVGGAMIGGGSGSMLGRGLVNGIAGGIPTEHFAMSTPAMGGLASAQCYGFPRVLAKIPKMFKSGYGYKETLGLNRSTTFVKLSECSGFIKCKNYKTDIIVATSEEKAEIERLMNEGVFI